MLEQGHIESIQTLIDKAILNNDLNLLTRLVTEDPKTVLNKTVTIEDGIILNIAIYLVLRLHHISNTDPDLLILLLQHGADLCLQDSTNNTLLDLIFFLKGEEYSHLRNEAFFFAQHLLEKCITPNQDNNIEILIFNSKQANQLIETLSNQIPIKDRLRIECNNIKQSLDAAFFLQEPPIIFAARQGFMSVIVALVENETNIDIKDRIEGPTGGATALIKAAQYGWLDIVQYLITQGAFINQQDNKGATALYQAVINGHSDIVQYLLENSANLNLTCSNVPLLLVAIKSKQIKCSRLLIQYGTHLGEEIFKFGTSVDLIFTNPVFDNEHQNMMLTLLFEYGLVTYQNAYAQDQNIQNACHVVSKSLEKLSDNPEIQQKLLNIIQNILDIVKAKPAQKKLPVITNDSTQQHHDNIHKPGMQLN